jgi:CubicO group peptidase (beta-lactamase class C family)
MVLAVLLLVTGCTESPAAGADPRAEAIMKIVHDTMADAHLKAVIVRVTAGGDEIVTRAVGESMTGVPATTDMHFRNGAVAISYVATLLLLLAEDGTVGLDDRLSRWLPDVPHAERVTLAQLAQMTSGYHDYVLGNDAFADAAYADPFRAYTTDDLLDEKVLQPLGLTGTHASQTAQLPEPALHAFTSERRQALRIPAGTAFYEESTYWNPSWTITHGAIQTSTIADLEATAVGIGSGTLLSAESYRRMVSPDLRGRTRAQPDCPTCAPMTDRYTYGYLPARELAIAVAVTFAPEAFDAEGNYTNAAQTLFTRIATELAPDDTAPAPR